MIGAAKWGILIRLFVISLELIGFYWFSSYVLLMDAIASSLDILSTFLLIFCIKLASRPPDEDHPFGHGRYEPIAGLQLGLLLVIIGGGMIMQQGFQISEIPKETFLDPRAWTIPAIATVLLEICYRIIIVVAKKQRSPALAADAVHYRIDALTSLIATLSLIGAALFPNTGVLIDHFGAIIIALLMIGIGIMASRNNLDQLMDKIPDPDFFDKVTKSARKVKGVLGTEKTKIQIYGPDAHVDIDVEVDPKLPVETAHKITQEVRAEIQKSWPAVRDVTVHIEPFYPNDH